MIRFGLPSVPLRTKTEKKQITWRFKRKKTRIYRLRTGSKKRQKRSFYELTIENDRKQRFLNETSHCSVFVCLSTSLSACLNYCLFFLASARLFSSVCVLICLTACLSARRLCVFVCLSVRLSFRLHLSACLSVLLIVCSSVCLFFCSFCLYACSSVCLSFYFACVYFFALVVTLHHVIPFSLQKYLTTLRKEKEAFETLIKDKGVSRCVSASFVESNFN